MNASIGSLLNEITALQEQFSRREADIAFERSGGEIFYAIDNDVITAITAPWIDEGPNVFGPLLTDWPEAARAFAIIFAEFVFNVRPGSPFLIIPPAQNELEGTWNAAYLQAEEALKKVDEHFQRLLSLPTDRIITQIATDEAGIFDAVAQAVNTIHGGRSSATELRRITRLSESGAIRRIDAFLDEERMAIAKFPNEQDRDIFDEMVQSWHRRLTAVRNDASSSNDVDAAVLAFIEFANRNYLTTGDQRRLCFVTGDSHIYRVASEVLVSGSETFSRRYLRRPTAFLVDRDFFSRSGLPQPSLGDSKGAVTESIQASVANWLREISLIPLSEIGTNRNRSTQLMKSITDARTSWGEYLKSSSALFSISPDEIRNTIAFYTQAANYLDRKEVIETFERLREQVAHVGEQAKRSFALAGALSRFWSLDATKEKQAVRSVPYVRFDSLHEAEGLANTIAAQRGSKLVELQRNKKWITDLHGEDKTNYTTMIIFSLAFASVSEWKTALNVAELAYAIARTQRSINPTARIKGDEAAYLCAIFERLSAQSFRDLDSCGAWLDEAERLRRLYPVRDDFDPSSDRPDTRFLAERLSLRLTRKLFIAYLPNAEHPAFGRALDDSINSYDALFHENFDELVRAHTGALDTRLRYAVDQFFVNAMQCAIIGNLWSSMLSEEKNYLHRRITSEINQSYFNGNLTTENGPRSTFSEFVLLTAGLLLASCDWATDQQTFLKDRLAAVAKERCLMPYDEPRRSHFLSLVGVELGT